MSQPRTMNQLFNRDKIILDLCGGTGAWSRPYAEAGYDVRVITIPEQDVRDYIPPGKTYGVLAAPPCTMFSLARTTAKTPRDIKGGLQVVDACIRIAFVTKPVFFALENPVGLLSKWIGKPFYIFDPFNFGENYSKRTALWGWFNKPRKIYNKKEAVMTEDEIYRCSINNRILPEGIGTQAEKRAITPARFAREFFEANR